MGVGGGCRARGAGHVAPVSRNRERRLLNHVCRCCSSCWMDGGVKVRLACVMWALWERACSRKGCVRRRGCWLIRPLREQARSHSWIYFVSVGFVEFVRPSSLASQTPTEYVVFLWEGWWLGWPHREQAKAYILIFGISAGLILPLLASSRAGSLPQLDIWVSVTSVVLLQH
ncbi:hypothetical protein PS624_01878 [Pseudomonas fluorescens]|uniref:Uncharacterized protein n=1 Tax=Pseudomonas fluorescens TaxID=294 RepID=A0A5E6S817_PSEFL|nr:hypothetical protein PS624_01878 [Pseudomonas fluorescens]